MVVRRIQLSGSCESGFTIIEVMIAFTILAIGLAAIGTAQLSALRLTTTSKHLSQAMYLAEEQMEVFRSMPWGPTFSIAAANVPDPANPLSPVAGDMTSYTRSWTIQPAQPPHGLTEITVTVVWTNSNGLRQTAALKGLKGA